jgi:hypothetical protein
MAKRTVCNLGDVSRDDSIWKQGTCKGMQALKSKLGLIMLWVFILLLHDEEMYVATIPRLVFS